MKVGGTTHKKKKYLAKNKNLCCNCGNFVVKYSM